MFCLGILSIQFQTTCNWPTDTQQPTSRSCWPPLV